MIDNKYKLQKNKGALYLEMGLEVIKQAPIYVQLDTKYNLLDWVATEGMSWRVVKPPSKRDSP